MFLPAFSDRHFLLADASIIALPSRTFSYLSLLANIVPKIKGSYQAKLNSFTSYIPNVFKPLPNILWQEFRGIFSHHICGRRPLECTMVWF
jgi:hypothetical protein